MSTKLQNYLVMSACLLWLLLLALSPIISRDALIHHMALPKLWLHNGAFDIDTYRLYAFYPSNLQVLYQAALFYNLEFLPKIIHGLFLFATGYLVYRYLKFSGINHGISLLGFVLILTIPICQRLVSEAYVDLGLLFFSTLSFICFLYWKNTDFHTQIYFYLSATSAGLALGTKYNGLLIVVILLSLCLLTHGIITKKYVKSLRYGCEFVVMAIIFASPWLIRNYFASGGNPFYPLFTSIFPDTIGEVKPLYTVLNHTVRYRMLEGESLTEIVLLPLRIFLSGEDNNFLQFDGKLNPMMLLLLPFAFMSRQNAAAPLRGSAAPPLKQGADLIPDKLLLLLFTVLIIMISVSSRDVRIRYLVSIIPPVVILNIMSLNYLVSYKRIILNLLACIFVFIYLSYNIVYGYKLLNRLEHINYLLGNESKVDYLRRKVDFYPLYEYINQHTKQNAVIYDVMSGHRSYYVDREYIHHPRHVDTVFMNYMAENRTYEDYEAYLKQVKTRHGVGVTHLLIRPYLFIQTFQRIFPNHDQRAVTNFIEFLNRQTFLLQSRDVRLYELIPRQVEPIVTKKTPTGAGG